MQSDLEWNMRESLRLVEASGGPRVVHVITGTATDRAYWEERLAVTKTEVFRQDGSTLVVSDDELVPRGNFLGSLIAWQNLSTRLAAVPLPFRDGVVLVSMILGQGTRLSPFTQALGNCKPRFPTPYRARSSIGVFLTIGELAALYSNLLIDTLQRGGFRGELIKWGDETIIPSVRWVSHPDDYLGVDAVRFVWATPPTDGLAREKDWVLYDGRTGSMLFQFPRCDLPTLVARAGPRLAAPGAKLAVNLGSVAASYDLLDAAHEVFRSDIEAGQGSIDWDPYFWTALACESEEEWNNELRNIDSGTVGTEREAASGFADLYHKVAELKALFLQRKGRPLCVRVLDFGKPLWTDVGQHLALCESLSALVRDPPEDHLTRLLFRLPNDRDDKGNTVINSRIHGSARITNSVIVDSNVSGGESVIDRGLIVGCQCGTVRMEHGGMALFCDVDDMHFLGPRAVAFQSRTSKLVLPQGGRHTTLNSPKEALQLFGSEAIMDYKGASYGEPVLGNSVSFSTASELMRDYSPDLPS